MSFRSEVQQQQNEDVASNLNSVISELKRAIISAARRGEKQFVLNNMLAGKSVIERHMIFKAAEAIFAEGGFEQKNHYAGQAGRYRNASGDLYVYVIAWE